MADAATSVRQIVAAIEAEFGRDWLLWKSGSTKRDGQRSHKVHPVAVAWAEAKELLSQIEAGAPVTDEFRPNIAFLDELVSDLEGSREIPNFARAIRPRLKTGEFEKAQFETNIGPLYQSAGKQVEFVPPSGKGRLADLKVILGQQDVFIECTRKDLYKPARHDDNAARKSLGDDILGIQRELGSSLEVIAVVLGTLDAQHSEDVLAAVRQAISKGARGMWTRPVEGIGLIVRELTRIELPSGTSVGPILPDAIMSPMSPKRLALAEGTYSVDQEGRPYITGEKRVSVYVIDSHRMASVADSFRDKRGQIPKEGSGVVYVNLDVSHVVEGDVDLYMQMAQGAVREALTTPPGNPQIAAVILMTTPTPLPVVLENGQVVKVLGRRYFLVRNPDGAIPEGFIIPGSAPAQEPRADPKE